MTTLGPKKTLALILGLFFLFYIIYYQNKYHQLIYQQKYDTKNDTVFQVGNATLKHCLAVIGNHSAKNDNSVSRQTDHSNPAPAPAQQPQVSPAQSRCFPYFTELYVKPVPEHDCDQPHIVMNDGGRLGNKMCQYASLYLLRHLYGVRVSVKKKMVNSLSKVIKNIVLPVHDANCFTSQTKNITYLAMYDKLYTAASQDRTNTTSRNLITKPLLDTSYYVYDYPNPRDLLLAQRDLVHSLFRFRDKVIQAAISNIDAVLKRFNATYYKRNFPIVTVHVRRTDYTKYVNKSYNITQLDELYFTRAFQFYKERLRRPVFLVVSDDPKWCRQNLQAKDVLVIASKFPEVDMAAMSLGDHHVTSYGTFSFMGALLGHGHITHPINNNTKYSLIMNKCVDSPFWHYISREKTDKVDNSSVVLL